MFSGIVDHCGTIVAVEQRQGALYARIKTNFEHIQEGESIAVDGVCLTALQPNHHEFYCDVSPETMSLTTAKSFAVNRKINLERALCYGDRVGGHLVSGHVDQCASVQNIQERDGFFLMTFKDIVPEYMPYLVKKGSVAINGVSLTINNVFADGFDVMLIPHTLQRTNLGDLRATMQVNLEFDQLVKTTINYLKQISFK
jgi:riboflavin synthase